MALHTDFQEVSPSVFMARGPLVVVTSGHIRELKAQASRHGGKARICAHASLDDTLHEMLIIHSRGSYVPPHRHRSKSESFHLFEGALDVVLFADGGEPRRVIRLSSDPREGALFYRLGAPQFHTVVVHSELAVFHESTNGPFREGALEHAPWAPAADQADAGRSFLERLRARIAAEPRLRAGTP